ncbi:putative protein OCTOPUS [Helianthus anomalus]
MWDILGINFINLFTCHFDPFFYYCIKTHFNLFKTPFHHNHPSSFIGLDSATNHLQSKHETIVSFPLTRRTRGHAGGAPSSTLPELRRSKSVAVEKCEILNDSFSDLRRKSCDVRVCNRIVDLFDVDDSKSGERVIEEDEEEEGEDLRMMKEHIEIELQNRKDKLWKTTLVFDDKL